MTAAHRQSHNRGTLNSLRAALLACAAAMPLTAHAQDADPRIGEIQTLLDGEQPAEAERLAREVLAEAEKALAARALETANIHRLLGDALYLQRRFKEAEPHFREAFQMRERFLGEHLDTAVSAADLGFTLRQLGRFEDAEPFYRKALDIRIALLGAYDPETARSWQRLARLVDQRGEHLRAAGLMDEAIGAGSIAFGADDATVMTWTGERAGMLHDGGSLEAAERDYRAVIAAAQAGTLMEQGPEEATAQAGLANLLTSRGQFEEAESLYKAALAARERMHGPTHAAVASVLEGLGLLYERQDRGEEALAAYERALLIRETVGGDFNAWSSSNLFRIGTVLAGLDRPAEAEAVFRRLLVLRETLHGKDAASVAEVLRSLAGAARRQDRLAEAESAYKRALAIDETNLPPDHPYIAFDLMLLGTLYAAQQRFAEARPLLERAVAAMEGNETARRSVPVARAALANLMFAEGDTEGAAALTLKSMNESREAGGPVREFADLSMTLAQIRLRQERWDEAERHAEEAASIYERTAPSSRAALRVLSIRGEVAAGRGDQHAALAHFSDLLGRLQAVYGADHAETITARFSVGRTLFALGDHAGAARELAASAAVVERLAAVDSVAAFSTRTGNVEDQAIARGAVFDGLVKAYARMGGDAAGEDSHAEAAFLIAQRVIESQAAHALAQMAARQAAGSGALAELARERQDAVARWRNADTRLTAALAAPPDRRDAGAVAAIRAELDATDAAIAALDARLGAEFPDFAELQRPAPIDFAAVRERLGENEVLLFFADTARFGGADWETYLWAIPKAGAPRWVRLPRSTGELMTAVRELRALMGVAGEARGAASLAAGAGRDRVGQVLAAAHALHGATLAPVADMIEGRDLVVVPSKRLAALPLHLLVSEMPAAGSPDRWRDAGWLAGRHAITMLPSVNALGAAGVMAAERPDALPYLGFANPLLTGRNDEDYRAFERDSCAEREPEHALFVADGLPELSSLFRGAAADVDAVRRLDPLPETADEACAIAETLDAGTEAVLLAGKATETEAKRLSGDGTLARARILHFATHGLISGELQGLAEPAIVMTPPNEATAEDDGLLTASEVSTLRLDADWVILSACNTAAGGEGGEALSGLARAFFYAGARSLMVSHWPVASDAAVRLATGAIGEIAADASVSRAEALRRAMVAEIEAGGRRADPANWAPFVVVGG